jgi:hypothetical protein
MRKSLIVVLAVLVFGLVGFEANIQSEPVAPIIVSPPGVICTSDNNGLKTPIPPEIHGNCHIGTHSDFGGSAWIIMATGAYCSPPGLAISAAASIQGIDCQGPFSLTGDGNFAFADAGDGIDAVARGYPFYFGHIVTSSQITSCYGNTTFSPPDASSC